MEFKVTINNDEFLASEETMKASLERLKLMYQYRGSNAYLALILLDSKEAREYIIAKMFEFIPNLYSYDISATYANLNDVDQYIKSQPTALYNLEEYFLRVSKEKNISLDEARELVFQGINMARDSVFLIHEAEFIMFLNDADYNHFIVSADDFTSYCSTKIDFNTSFINKDGLSLSEYYIEANEKVFRK